MNHFFLILACIASVELLTKLNLFKRVEYTIIIIKKVVQVISSKKISDHWKEIAVPIYSIKLMQGSLQILFILFAIIIIFFLFNLVSESFIEFLISFFGIFESIAIVYIYIWAKNFFKYE